METPKFPPCPRCSVGNTRHWHFGRPCPKLKPASAKEKPETQFRVFQFQDPSSSTGDTFVVIEADERNQPKADGMSLWAESLQELREALQGMMDAFSFAVLGEEQTQPQSEPINVKTAIEPGWMPPFPVHVPAPPQLAPVEAVMPALQHEVVEGEVQSPPRTRLLPARHTHLPLSWCEVCARETYHSLTGVCTLCFRVKRGMYD